MQVGDLVKAKTITYKQMVPDFPAPDGVGIVTRVAHGYGRLIYVYWGAGEPRPIHTVLLEKIK